LSLSSETLKAMLAARLLEPLLGHGRRALDLLTILRRAGYLVLPKPAPAARLLTDLALGEHRLSLLLRFHAHDQPDGIALITDELRLTYGELDARVNACAHVLLGLGVRASDRVAARLPNGSTFIEVAFACARLGVSFTPIGTHLKQREVAYILENSSAQLLVTTPELRVETRVRTLETGVGPDSYKNQLARASRSDPPRAGRGSKDAVLMYTSGTTGRPKGARRDVRASAIAELLYMVGGFDLTRHERFFICTPLYHATPWAFSNMILGMGATLVLAEKWHGLASLERMSKLNVTGMLVVPTLVRRWLDLPQVERRRAHPRRLTKVVSAGARFPSQWKVEASAQIGPIFYDFYGATELGVISISDPQQTRQRPETVGRALPHIELRILRPDGCEAAVGERGELFARGQNFDGYHGEADKNRPDAEGFISVGDIATLDMEGYLSIVDRIADMVISGGVNLYPAEIEQVLREHPAISDAAVIGVPDEEFGEALHAFVVLAVDETLSAEAVVAHCESQLAKVKRPKFVTFLESLPRSPQGKVLKRELSVFPAKKLSAS